MRRFIGSLFLFAALLLSFCSGAGLLQEWRSRQPQPSQVLNVHPERDVPLKEIKTFAVVLHAHNAAAWCRTALRSVFEQNYEAYRVLFVDDGSTDGTFEVAQQFIIDHEQQHRVIAIRNEEPLGQLASLYRAASYCLDQEILVPLEASDWLAHEDVLTKLNAVFQNHDLWLAYGEAVEYPSYRFTPTTQQPAAFYSALFKSIPLTQLFVDGSFAQSSDVYLAPLVELAGGRTRILKEPLVVINRSLPARHPRESDRRPPRIPVAPLAHFPAKTLHPEQG